MNLDEQLRGALRQEAERTHATRPPDIDGVIGGGLARRRRRDAVRAGIAAVAVLSLGGGAYVAAHLASDTDASQGSVNQPASTNEASTGPGGDDGSLPASGPIDPGTYHVDSSPSGSVTDYSITFPEGWTVAHDRVTFYKNKNQPGEIILDPFVVDAIFSDACSGNDRTAGDPVPVGPGTDALIDALSNQGHGAAVGPPVPTTLGDHRAIRVDLTVPSGMDVSVCRIAGALQIWRTGSGYLAFPPGETIRIYILDIDGERQVFVTNASTASAADRSELRGVLDSIRIGS